MDSFAKKFSILAPAARVLWAKSGEGAGHGILAHLLDVAAVAETLLDRESVSTVQWAAEQFGLPVKHVTRWIAVMAGLHDFGKAIPGFQAKWAEGMQADQGQGLGFNDRACTVSDHSCATAALLKEALRQVADIEHNWMSHAIQAISAHHGYHFTRTEVGKAKPSGEASEWKEARLIILQTYWALLAPEGAPAIDALTTPAVNWLAGLTSVADWIASNPEWFPLGERRDDLQDYYQDARQLAAQALNAINWLSTRSLIEDAASTNHLLGRIIGYQGELSARPLQQVGDSLLQSASGPSLLLVEAPMGEGKTELAFLAHLRLQAANKHRGLYVALPTQATGNAMFKRALTFLHGFSHGTMDIQLVHGGATLNEDVQHLRDINHSKEESLSASGWFSQRRRPLLSPYGVGTIDQALFAVLNVKHHFVRLWGLSNRVVVLDEVHAYDTYTSGLIEFLLQWLKALGSSVVLMSATLPQSRRDDLLRAWGAESTRIPDLSYPRVLLMDAGGVRGESFSARPLASIRVAAVREELDALVECACQLVDSGGCGAVIVNTVERAQKLYGMLRERLDESTKLLLFHARFPADQRAEREREVLALFGREGKRPVKALLIATQVVEQSLDIDFDFMLSDLAPVDLLLQRAGRLHRHTRPRLEQHAQACLYVAGLHKDRLPDLKETAWGFVYDPYILGRTWALLSRECMLDLPGDIDRFVQAVYGDEPLPDDLEDRVRNFIEIKSFGEYMARVKVERMQSLNIAIDPNHEPQNAYANKPKGNEEGDGLGLTNKTRLGDESLTLVPVHVSDAGWRVRADTQPFQPNDMLDDYTARQLYLRHIKVSQKVVVSHFKAIEPPVAFAQHPLLKNIHPLPLQGGRYDNGGLHIRLDEELGFVYERSKESIEETV